MKSIVVVPLFLFASMALAGPKVAAPTPVGYPEGYRGWTHLKSMAITSAKHPLFEAFGGLHHVYVNKEGLESAKSNKPYPNGSVLVFDLLTADEKDGALTEGARKFIGVMVKNDKLYATTGGWGFEAFKGDSKTERVVKDATTQCFNCHTAQQASDYTFAKYRQ